MDEHTEEHAVRRVNPTRLRGATLVVCMAIVRGAGIRRVEYHARDSTWVEYLLTETGARMRAE